jgi:hypothetical protein
VSGQYLSLKWGTLKGWDFTGNDEAIAAMKRYNDDGHCASAIMQNDTDAQVQAMCDMIDAVDGPIYNEWEGTTMTKDEAKAYVRNYDRKGVHGS